MKLTIKSVSNGYILSYKLGDHKERIVISAYETTGGRAEATAEMLNEVVELIGHRGTRYDEKRVYIKVEPGDKWISPEEAKQMLGEV